MKPEPHETWEQAAKRIRDEAVESHQRQIDALTAENAALKASLERIRELIAECDELDDVRVDVDQLRGVVGGYFE